MKGSYPKSLILESQAHATPAFWFSGKRIRENYHRFSHGLPGSKVFFPLKVNSEPEILKILAEEGSNFDAASLGEIKILRKLGISSDRIIFTTPVKAPDEIKAAHKEGVRIFVVDSLMEIAKLAQLAPGSKVMVRIQTTNKGSQWPLSRRFGAEPKQAPSLLQYIVDQKLIPYGITFHVGSQCITPKNWQMAIRKAAKIIKDFEKKNGTELQALDVGGGFPVCYKKDVPSLENIFEVIRREIKAQFGNRKIDLIVEPGRSIVADSAFAVATVIGRMKRGRNNWLFCDLGAFNGLLELIEPSSKGFGYELYAPTDTRNGNGKQKRFILTGPSCDGDDILAENVELPNIGVGDRIYFLKTGAYSVVYGSKFCGNTVPKVFVV